MSVLDRLARDLHREAPSTINLMAREGCVEDLAQCYALHASWLPYGNACLRALVEMWRALLSTRSMLLFLVEDRAKPIGLRIISFAATIFVTDELCREVQLTGPPFRRCPLFFTNRQKCYETRKNYAGQ